MLIGAFFLFIFIGTYAQNAKYAQEQLEKQTKLIYEMKRRAEVAEECRQNKAEFERVMKRYRETGEYIP